MQKPLILTTIVVFTAASNAQKIETERSDRSKVIHVQTTPNHLSVIEFKEPVTEVAAGSSSYKIEWQGNKVFVQPLEPDARTNLFIWTAVGRLNYELVPASSVETMHFAIDQEAAPDLAKSAEAPQPHEDPELARQARLTSDLLFASRPVHLFGEVKNGSGVQVILKDILRQENRVYVRYAIQNRATATYRTGTPQVFALRSPRSRRSLYGLRENQVLGNATQTIRSSGQAPLKVLDSGIQTSTVPPGSSTYGLVSFESPARASTPAVIRFTFPSDHAGEVSATLIL